MSAEREPTLEELMAELDAAANDEPTTASTDVDFSLDEKKEPEPFQDEQAPVSAPKEKAPVSTPTTEVKAVAPEARVNPTQVEVDAAKTAKEPEKPINAPPAIEENRRDASTPSNSKSTDAKAANELTDGRKAKDTDAEVVQKSQNKAKKQESSTSSFTSQLESFWKSAKASAEEMLPMKDDLSSKVGNILATAGDSISAAASNVGTAARTRNAKILMKPYASFGVPLELIMKRECGDDTAEQVPAVIQKLLSFLDKNRGVDGDLPLDFFSKPRAAADRDRLLDLRDEIDLVCIACIRLSPRGCACSAGRVPQHASPKPASFKHPAIPHKRDAFLRRIVSAAAADAGLIVVSIGLVWHRGGAGEGPI
jgi:hypothetical protein